MTLHGSKGLTLEVVFIPGLEQGLPPSERDTPFSGLVQQAARRMILAAMGAVNPRHSLAVCLEGSSAATRGLTQTAAPQ